MGSENFPRIALIPPPFREGSYYKFAKTGAGALMRGWLAPSCCKQIFLLLDYEPRLFPVGYIFGGIGERVKQDKKRRVKGSWGARVGAVMCSPISHREMTEVK
jgi:hypothetical protein